MARLKFMPKNNARSMFLDPALRMGIRVIAWTVLITVALVYANLLWIVVDALADVLQFPAGENKNAELRNIGLILTALFGAPFVAWRSIIAQQQAKISEEGLVTDRFANAVGQLTSVRAAAPSTDCAQSEANPDHNVRLAGLYALERLSQNYPSIHSAVLNTMCSYVTDCVPAQLAEDQKYIQKTTNDDEARELRPDIYMAIVILGRRATRLRQVYEREGARCSLVGSHLEFADFDGANFSHSNLSYCNLSRSRFRDANLEEAYLTGSIFYRSDLKGCNLKRATLLLTDLSGAHSLTGPQLQRAYGVKRGIGETLLPDDIPPPTHWFDPKDHQDDNSDFRDAYFAEYQKWLKNDRNRFLRMVNWLNQRGVIKRCRQKFLRSD